MRPQPIDPVLQAAYSNAGVNNLDQGQQVQDPVLQSAYDSAGLSNEQTSVPHSIVNYILSALKNNQNQVMPGIMGTVGFQMSPSTAAATKVPLASVLNLGKQVGNLATTGLNKLGTNIPQMTFDPNQTLGIPSTPGFNMATNIGSGVLGAAIPGLDIAEGSGLGLAALKFAPRVATQAGIGASLDPQNRVMGATLGALGTAPEAILGGIAGHLSNQAERINELKNPTGFVGNNIPALIDQRKQNLLNALTHYSFANEASDAPLIPGQQYQSNIIFPTFGGKFNPQQAVQFQKTNPQLFGANYSGIEGLDPAMSATSNISSVDAAMGPNFSKLMEKRFPLGTEDFGTDENPLQPVQAYQDMVRNGDIGSALEARRIFNQAKGNASTLQSQLLDTGQKQIKTMVVNALRNYDTQNGTSIADQYLAGDAPYKQEMEILGNNQLDNLTSGRILPANQDPQRVNNILTNAQENGHPFVQPGTPAFNFNQILSQKLANAKKIKSTGKMNLMGQSLTNLANNYLSPFARTSALLGSEANNQGR